MPLKKISLAQTRQFSKLLSDYLSQKPDLQSFYQYFPSIENFPKLISELDFSPEKRKILHRVLSEQYADFQHFPKENIDRLLNEKTFTITTGHQLNIFSGPLYVIYKLISTLNLAKQLQSQFPDYQFIPVYWMATEDHDFEEINHFELFGKNYSWQTSQTGAVGRFNPQEMSEIFSQLPEKIQIFEDAYLRHTTLADATRYWVNELFGAEGLLCIDADNQLLKAEFQDIMQADIFTNQPIQLFEKQTEKLETIGYERQINGREINFFFLDKNKRERIVKTDEKYEVLNTDISFSEEELKNLIHENPEKFSPNVLLRPVYQQVILPNLAYIGGPAEIAYWFQLKEIFVHFGVSFPVLLPRNFALFVNKTNVKKLEKLGISAEDLFAEETELKRNFVEKNTENPIDLQPEQRDLDKVFENLVQKALKTDASLEGFVKAERQKAVTSLENIEKRLKKAEEQKQATQLNQLLTLRQKLFPENGLQERHDNFLSFYLNNPDFLKTLLENFNPLEFEFYIFTEE